MLRYGSSKIRKQRTISRTSRTSRSSTKTRAARCSRAKMEGVVSGEGQGLGPSRSEVMWDCGKSFQAGDGLQEEEYAKLLVRK